MLRKILSFGFYVKEYEKQDTVQFPSIGRYNTKGFHPDDFHSIFPNPAYENMTLRDAYWGAKRVAAFRDDQIDAIVATGRYSNPDAANYLAQQLKGRRDIIVRYWFERMPPLDHFELVRETERTLLVFEDLAVLAGIVQQEASAYRYRIGPSDGLNGAPWHPVEELAVVLQDGPSDALLQVELQLRRGDQNWSQSVHIYARQGKAGEYTLVGIRRDTP